MTATVHASLRSLAYPATVGAVLSVALVVRLAVGGRSRSWAVILAGLGYAAYATWLLAVLAVLPTGNMDFAAFYRAGKAAAGGVDPYLLPGELVPLNPPPAVGVFRLIAALPYPVAGVVWSAVTGLLALALIPLSDRVVRRDHDDDPDAAPGMPHDVAALLGAAVVTSNASIWGHRSGQLSVLTALAVLLAIAARQRGRPVVAGVGLAVAGFKPATMIPFLVLFLRKADRPAWVSLAAVSLGLGLVAEPSWGLKDRVVHNVQLIEASGVSGRINDYGFGRDISSDIVAFNHLFHRVGVRDRRVVSVLQWASVAVVLAALFAVRDRRPFVAAASVVSAGSMLFLYHRLYDAVVLALPLALCASLAVHATGRRRGLALATASLLLGVINQPRDFLISVTSWSRTHGTAGRVVQAVVLPYASWSILLTLLGLSLCAFAGRRPSGE